MKSKLTSIAWEKVPWSLLPSSAQVDLGLWMAGLKPSVRIITADMEQSLVYSLQKLFFLDAILAYESTIYLAADINEIRRIHDLDYNPDPHEKEIGSLLGYPTCCSNFISEIGESAIDDVEQEYFTSKIFAGSLLDTSLYSKGISLISHVPCELECKSSQSIATAFYDFVKNFNGGQVFCRWQKQITDFYGHHEFATKN